MIIGNIVDSSLQAEIGKVARSNIRKRGPGTSFQLLCLLTSYLSFVFIFQFPKVTSVEVIDGLICDFDRVEKVKRSLDQFDLALQAVLFLAQAPFDPVLAIRCKPLA